ncbi:unnamed protein product [Musa banksii]
MDSTDWFGGGLHYNPFMLSTVGDRFFRSPYAQKFPISAHCFVVGVAYGMQVVSVICLLECRWRNHAQNTMEKSLLESIYIRWNR